MHLHPPDDKAGEHRVKERGRPDREPPRLGFWLVLSPEGVRGWGGLGGTPPGVSSPTRTGALRSSPPPRIISVLAQVRVLVSHPCQCLVGRRHAQHGLLVGLRRLHGLLPQQLLPIPVLGACEASPSNL